VGWDGNIWHTLCAGRYASEDKKSSEEVAMTALDSQMNADKVLSMVNEALVTNEKVVQKAVSVNPEAVKDVVNIVGVQKAVEMMDKTTER